MLLVRRLARARIVQFAVIGGLIFAFSTRRNNDNRQIAFSSSELAALHAAEASRNAGADPRTLAAEVDERAIEDEILYREGLKRSFDRDDTIIRQRVIQRTLFFAEEMAGASEPPTEADLHAFFERTRERWTRAERFDFTQRFTRNRDVVADLAVHPERGDPSPVPPAASMERAALAALVGEGFVAELSKVSVGATVMVASPFGWHLVTLRAHTPEQQGSFEEALPRLRLAYTIDRRKAAVAAMLDKAFQHYTVTIDGNAVVSLRPNGRVAMRRSGSAED
jgi:hypothetical protein